MLLVSRWRRIALSVIAAAAAMALASPAEATSDPDEVGPAEYHRVHSGITARQLDQTVHFADFGASGPVRCRTREYRGWDRDHYRVYVVLSNHVVQYKAVAPRNEVDAFACSPADPHD